MKKILLTFFLLLLNIFTVQSVYAQTSTASSDPWVIEKFHSFIQIQEDSSLLVEERITLNFDEKRRGIFRDIPIHYKDKYDQPYNLRFELVSVKDAAGHTHPYSEEYQWPFIRIRIGDANVFLTGRQYYTITYKVKRAYTRQQTSSGSVLEFPWNVTGSWGEADMQEVSATIQFPASVNAQDVNLICFTGYEGSMEKNCSITKSGQLASFRLQQLLPKGEQFTASIQIPLDQIGVVSQAEEWLWFLQDNYMMVFGLGMILLILVLWYFYGREYPIGSIVTAWKVPPTLTPMLAKYLTHEVVSSKDLPASLIYLATRDYITITKTTTGYTFERTVVDDADVPNPDQRLLKELFDVSGKKQVTTAQLKNTFYKKVPLIIGLTDKEVMERKWFYKNPGDVRALYIFAGIVITIVAVFTSLVLDQGFGFMTCILAGIIWFFVSLSMPKMTRAGKKEHATVLGIKEYIARAESLRLRVKNPAGHTKKAFDNLLPFAMVFGLEKEWAKQFEDILSEPSSWLHTDDATPFTAAHFGTFLHTFSKSSASALVSAPVTYSSSSSSSSYSSSGGSSFSSGGSSGGGFGGGGGGSW